MPVAAHKPKSVRGRLLLLMALVIAPLTILNLCLAWIAYRLELGGLNNPGDHPRWIDFLALTFLPLVVTGVLALFYALAIQRDVVAGVDHLSAFAAAPLQAGDAPKPDPAMPEELQGVYAALYKLKSDASAREAALMSSSQSNHALTLELHHRVKNSLQVIQSYLSLSRRESTGESRPVLALTEARVQVIATAYRLALNESGLNRVPVDVFVAQIINTISVSLCHPHQSISSAIELETEIHIDRLIPLGLSMVEMLGAALAESQISALSVSLSSLDAEAILIISLGALEQATLEKLNVSAKLLNGLSAQLGAQKMPTTDRQLLHWRFPLELPD